MKHTIKVFAALAFALLTFSCSNTDDAAGVAAKIENGESLSEADYGVMIDYCGKFAQEAQRIQNDINAEPNMSAKATTDTDRMTTLSDSYKYLESFGKALNSADASKVGAANVEKMQKLAGYEWFPLPEWLPVQNAQGVVGDVVEMPRSDSDSVIATGVGEAVD